MYSLSHNVLDIVQNSLSAGAHMVKIVIKEDPVNNTLSLLISDDGSGMTDKQSASACDPFYTTKDGRSTGLGLSLLKMSAEMTGGEMKINSLKGKGTDVYAVFNTLSIDMKPMGDIVQTVALLIYGCHNSDFIYRHEYGQRYIELNTLSMREILGEVGLHNAEVYAWILEYLREKEIILHGGAVSNENTG